MQTRRRRRAMQAKAAERSDVALRLNDDAAASAPASASNGAATPTSWWGLHHTRQHKLYIMGVTSMWLVLPIMFGACARLKAWEVPIALLVWTRMTCFISTTTYFIIGLGSPTPGVWRAGWGWGKPYYYVDKLCAPVMFVALLVFFAMGHGARPLSLPVTLGAIPAAVGVFFLSSRFFELCKPHAVAATCCHLTFRYIGYWWVYLALTPPAVERLGFGFAFAINSAFYWGHIAYSIVRTGRRASFQLTEDYLRGCLEIAVLMAALYIAYRATTPPREDCSL